MKPWILIAALVLVCACTPHIYGVPQPTWDRMSEAERVEAMHLYNERQIAYQQAAAERARLRSLELERQHQREAEEARLRELRFAAIYGGDGGYGELVRIRLQGGWIKLSGRFYAYAPVTFLIANHEYKTIEILDGRGRKGHLQVYYVDGNLYLDGNDASHKRHALLIGQNSGWHDGKLYSGLRSSGSLSLKDVSAYVEVVRDRHGNRYPASARPRGNWFESVKALEPVRTAPRTDPGNVAREEGEGGILRRLQRELEKENPERRAPADNGWAESERTRAGDAYKGKRDSGPVDTAKSDSGPVDTGKSDKSKSDKSKSDKSKSDKSKSDKSKSDKSKSDKSNDDGAGDDSGDEDNGHGKKNGHTTGR